MIRELLNFLFPRHDYTMTTSIDKNKGFGRIKRMKELFLKRRVIKELYKVNLRGIHPSRNEFTDYFAQNKKGIFLYCNETIDIYHQRIGYLLGDCIAPHPSVPREQRIEYYIDYDSETRTLLFVTEKGREFISIGGFIQTIGGKFSKMWALFGIVLSFVVGTYFDTIIELVKHIFNL